MNIVITPTTLIIIAIVLALVALLVAGLRALARRRVVDPELRQSTIQQWQQIEAISQQSSPLAWKVAVVEADKLVDHVLKTLGVPGKDFGERIRAASYQHSQLRGVWPAHSVRNRLVHEQNYQLDRRTMQQALVRFRQALQVLRALAIVVLVLATPLVAQAAVDYDLGITHDDIRLSGGQVVAGKVMNVIARIRNYGNEDVRGYATFAQGGSVLGQSQEISILSGTYDDAWVEFTVPQGSFNISVQVHLVGHDDQNPANNYDQTAVFTPDIDTDGDGIGNQTDSDDDNDGLTDQRENELGTDPLKQDTDSDGHADADDVYPLDPKRWQEPKPVVPLVIPKPAPVPPSPAVKTAVSPAVETAAAVPSPAEAAPTVTEPEILSGSIVSSVQRDAGITTVAIITQSIRWATREFRTDIPIAYSDAYTYQWDFGDGSQSTDRLLTHRFPGAGTYSVRLTVETADRVQLTDTTTVVVSWWHIGNWQVQLLIGLLAIVGGGLGYGAYHPEIIARLSRQQPPPLGRRSPLKKNVE